MCTTLGKDIGIWDCVFKPHHAPNSAHFATCSLSHWQTRNRRRQSKSIRNHSKHHVSATCTLANHKMGRLNTFISSSKLNMHCVENKYAFSLQVLHYLCEGCNKKWVQPFSHPIPSHCICPPPVSPIPPVSNLGWGAPQTHNQVGAALGTIGMKSEMSGKGCVGVCLLSVPWGP